MTNHKNRLAKLEAAQPSEVKQYYCIYYDNPREDAVIQNGYDAFTHGKTRETIHFDTLDELAAFEARPDVKLTRVVICYTSDATGEPQPVSKYTDGDYSFTVGLDMGEI